jgi:hypothetical protein
MAANVFNGVCGVCLEPIRGAIHDESGKLIKYTKPKGKKRASPEIKRIVRELERFGRLNNEDIPIVVAALKQSR